MYPVRFPKLLREDADKRGKNSILVSLNAGKRFRKWVVAPSIVPSVNFAEQIRTATCMVLKANDRRSSSPFHYEFRGPQSDYARQVTLATKQLNGR
ncbi:hypothetical protein TNCV_4635161 [Trichonephila clavipes]|nr:hypothetical protein TNCV_4635161 [Trichonephila clavipes]